MNKSIIESIYNADRIFFEEDICGEEFLKAKKEFCTAYENFLKTLTEEQQKLIDDVFFLHENMSGLGYSQKFKNGFIFGFNLAQEILNAT